MHFEGEHPPIGKFADRTEEGLIAELWSSQEFDPPSAAVELRKLDVDLLEGDKFTIKAIGEPNILAHFERPLAAAGKPAEHDDDEVDGLADDMEPNKGKDTSGSTIDKPVCSIEFQS